MKRLLIIVLTVSCFSTGCTFGRRNGEPGYFTRLYNRIHPNNVGAPCSSGNCGVAPPMGVPMMAPQASIAPGCSTCGGGESVGYGDYSGYEGYSDMGHQGEVYGSSPYGEMSPSTQIMPGYDSGMEMIRPMSN